MQGWGRQGFTQHISSYACLLSPPPWGAVSFLEPIQLNGERLTWPETREDAHILFLVALASWCGTSDMHYVPVHGLPRHATWLVAACFSAARYLAKKWLKVSVHCTQCHIVVPYSDLHKELWESHLGKGITGDWCFFSSFFNSFCSNLLCNIVQSPGNVLCAPTCFLNANKQVNNPSVVMFQPEICLDNPTEPFVLWK